MLQPFTARMGMCLFAFLSVMLNASAQDTLSLNGYWKFQTLFGDGSNYLDIQPTDEDFVFDNSQSPFVEVHGKWQTIDQMERGVQHWKSNFLKRYFHDGDDAYVRFKSDVPNAGYYEHFIYYPFGNHLTTQVNIRHAHGTYTQHISQRNRNARWVSLGIFKVDPAADHFTEVTAITHGQVVADAVMLRPVSEETIRQAHSQKISVFKPEYDDTDWHDLKVPGHWGMINEFANYTGKGWYRKAFNLPDTWTQTENERIRVAFDGVYHLAKVYLNGTYIGTHQGGFTPFEFDVTDQLNPTGENILAVQADNNFIVGATWNWGGIIRDVRLIRSNEVRIPYQYIHAEPNLTDGTATWELKVRVENNAAVTRTLSIQANISHASLESSQTIPVQVPAHSIREFSLTGTLTADQVKLWHFDRPELYTLTTTLLSAGNPIHVKRDRFGIRKFEATSTQMLLNGEPVRLVGFNRVSDHRYWGSSEPQELIDFDVDMMKQSGANFMRIMHGTQNKRLLDRCDEQGILIVEEANIRELTNPELTAPDYPLAKQWIQEMIERDVNHPCIVGWSVGNELTEHFHYVKSTYEFAKRLDPNRMALHVSNQGYKPGESAENNPLAYGDMIFQNIYSKNPGAIMDTLHNRWPDQAMFFSEFGIERFTSPSLDNDIPGLGPWYDLIRSKRPYTTGASIWTYNDYKSGYNLTLASENRAWGLVNAWRTKRRSYYTHRRENSPLKRFEVKNLDLANQTAQVAIQIRTANDFPSFALKGYQLRYELLDETGQLLSQQTAELPDLLPGMDLITQEIAWPRFRGRPNRLHVALMTPNGYNRHDQTIFFEVPNRPVIDEAKVSAKGLRVHFTKASDAFEYELIYTVDGQRFQTDKTIAPYIELDSLPAGSQVEWQLVAWNGKGASQPSKRQKATLQGAALAPIIWDAFIADNKLVVGYSGEWADQSYTIRYGKTPQSLDDQITSHARGMMTVDLAGETTMYLQLKRTLPSGDSQWSPIIQAQSETFRRYE
ncbi:glycoside hydrolase family 2 TIM barrel-domain containing protein [Pontibacter sp. G13]|uniref:glycoside hydrolase family 2 TIM barrel-domain containing protein n=1 Tax=Pontibacter sp. G13 TaxID=3074898 RepID=UPI002889A29C|nr:glycoside hydrolase family 2 TIM barrel-domain containing protein [Pontibacter sp. G13]WNJ16569.1 glycoside hydrolase family 2 TIM barrel-domain containing protein [Pontibacter sp. G13]